MIGQTLFPEEAAVTARADVGGVVGATSIFTLGLTTSVTFFTATGMMSNVVGLVGCFALDAKVTFSQEAGERITTVVMFTHFDEDDLFVTRWPFENDLIIMVQGKHHDLIIGEMMLEGVEFGESTRSFTRCLMEGLGLSGLSRFTASKGVVLGVPTTQVTVGFHGDQSPCTTEFILVVDGDDTLFTSE